MLDLLFSSRDRVKLLQVLLLGTEEDYYLRELAEAAGVAVGAAQREVPRLVKLGLLTKRRRGNRIYLKVNKRCPIYPELRMMFVKTYGPGAIIEQVLEKGSDEIDLAFIHGSVADGTFGPKSDIDLMVVGKISPVDLSGLLSRAQKKLHRLINSITYSRREFRKMLRERSHFLNGVRKNRKLYIIGDDGIFDKLVARKATQKA